MISKNLILITAALGTMISVSSSAMAQGYYGPMGYYPRPHFTMPFGYRPRPTYYYVAPRYYRAPMELDAGPVVVIAPRGCDLTYGCGSVQRPMTEETIDIKETRIKRTY